MARSENPIPSTAGALGELAQRLRRYRDRAGLNYRQLADKTHFSYSQLSRAAAGKEPPTWDVTQAYLRGCGITGPRSLEVLRRLWEQAVRGRRTIHPPRWSEVPLTQVHTREEFAKQLKTLAYREASSVRQIAQITDQKKTSVADWITGRAMPTPAALDRFATLLGATEAEKADLHDARTRVLEGGQPGATAAIRLLDELEPNVDEETFLTTLLAMVDHAVTIEQFFFAHGDETATRRVQRRAAGTPAWEAADAGRLDVVLNRFPNHPDTFAPKVAIERTTAAG